MMECKTGYHGPLCAVCDEGWFPQTRECVECQEPRLAYFAFVFLGVVAAGVAAILMLRKHLSLLRYASAFAIVKIFIAFVTVVLTVNTQVDLSSSA